MEDRGLSQEQLVKATQEMQAEVLRLQKKIAETMLEAEAGEGLVKMTLTGQYTAIKVNFDDSLLQDNELGELEELVAEAFNNGVKKITTMTQEEVVKMKSLHPGLKKD